MLEDGRQRYLYQQKWVSAVDKHLHLSAASSGLSKNRDIPAVDIHSALHFFGGIGAQATVEPNQPQPVPPNLFQFGMRRL
jgi:hypothetical protein